MEVKICGITNIDDALLARDCGADYIGLIFIGSSPRAVSPSVAGEIKVQIGKTVKVVGVFADQTPSAVNELSAALDLEYVQLHGDESPDYCRMIERPCIKALSIGLPTQSNGLGRIAEIYASCSEYLLFDKPKKLSDSGWLDQAIEQLLEINGKLPRYFFAGGLNSENVETVLSRLNPTALDIASGLEQEPGKKDPREVAAFMNLVKASVQLERQV